MLQARPEKEDSDLLIEVIDEMQNPRPYEGFDIEVYKGKLCLTTKDLTYLFSRGDLEKIIKVWNEAVESNEAEGKL